MTSTRETEGEMRLDDEVLRVLTPLEAGADVGFVAASLNCHENTARMALEGLVLSGQVDSAPVRSSGGVFRLYRAKENTHAH